MTQIPPEQQWILDDCDRAARDTSHGGGLCETHHAQMVDATEDPTLPADDITTAQSTTDVTDDCTPSEDSAYNPDEIDMWTLYSGATYALTHFFRGKEGDALDGYVRTANDILFNPDGALEHVEQAYEQQLEAEGDDGSQVSLAGERAIASIERVSDDLQEKVDQFEERENALRERLQDAMN